MSAPAYGSVSKAGSAVLDAAYPAYYKVDLKTKASNGFVFGVEAAVGDIPEPADKSKRPDPRVVAKVESVAVGPHFKVDKIAVDSHKIVNASFSLAGVVPGAKFTFAATDASRATPTEKNKPVLAKLGASYNHEFATATAEVEAINKDATVTVAGKYEGVVAGVSYKAKFASGLETKDYGLLVGYQTKDVTAAVETSDKFNWFTATYAQTVNPDVKVAASAKIPRNKDVKEDVNNFTTFSAGVTYKAAADVTWAAKVVSDSSSKGQLHLGYAQQLSASAKTTIGAKLDLVNPAGNEHSFTAAFSLTA